MKKINCFLTIFILVGGFLLENAANAQQLSSQCDNKSFLQTQQELENNPYQRSKKDVPVHICGKVIAYSKARYTRSGEHGYFYMQVGNGVSIRIVSNLDEMQAPTWPWVRKGDYVEVVGRYYFDNFRRQGIDWTHKGTSRKWPYPGYVMVNGKKYD